MTSDEMKINTDSGKIWPSNIISKALHWGHSCGNGCLFCPCAVLMEERDTQTLRFIGCSLKQNVNDCQGHRILDSYIHKTKTDILANAQSRNIKLTMDNIINIPSKEMTITIEQTGLNDICHCQGFKFLFNPYYIQPNDIKIKFTVDEVKYLLYCEWLNKRFMLLKNEIIELTVSKICDFAIKRYMFEQKHFNCTE